MHFTGRDDASLLNHLTPILLSNLYLPVPRQSYQSGQSQYVYQHEEEKEVYQIDSDLAPEVNKEDLNAENSYFTNKGYKKLQVNFVRIESICDCCSTSFQSYSTLYRHIKSGYNTLEKIAVAEAGSDLLSSRLVLCSAAKLSASGSGFTFRDWSYAITSITFDPIILPTISDPNTLVCLNIDCGVSLVDKNWLVKKHFS